MVPLYVPVKAGMECEGIMRTSPFVPWHGAFSLSVSFDAPK